MLEKTEAADLIEQNVAELMQLCYRGASAGVGLNFPARRLARSLALAPPGAAHHRFGARERALSSPARRHARLDRGRARGGRAPRPLGVSTIPRARAPGAGAGSGARVRARATARTRPSPPQARSGRTTRPRRTRAGRASTCRRAAPRRPPTASGPRPWSRHPSQVAARAARRVLPLGQPARRAASANASPEPTTRARARRVASPPSSPRSRRTSQIADEGGPATHQLVAATVIPDRSAARRGARAIATDRREGRLPLRDGGRRPGLAHPRLRARRQLGVADPPALRPALQARPRRPRALRPRSRDVAPRSCSMDRALKIFSDSAGLYPMVRLLARASRSRASTRFF